MRPEPNRSTRRVLPLRARHAVLTVHIIMSVGVLGDAAGFLAIAIRAATTDDRLVAVHAVEVLQMLSLVFGIPLSVGALLTGLTLGVGTKWGIFRYPWVTTKLLLLISVMVVGGLIIGPAQEAMLDGAADTSMRLIAAASYDVLALAVATTLSVFKPGRPFKRGDRTAIARAEGQAS